MLSRPTVLRTWGLFFAAAAAIFGACRRDDTTSLTELQRLRSGALEIVLLSSRDALRHGRDAFVLEFRSTSSGTPVDVGNVRASATMPMPGMAMFGSVDVGRTSVTGRYAGSGQFEMAGTWRMTIDWEGPAGPGSVSFSIPVQ